MKKVIVTGASGFIGKHALSFLINKGYEVHGIYYSKIIDNIPNIIWHKANLLDPSETQALFDEIKPSHLLHLAWDVSQGFRDSSSNFDWLDASIHILKVFEQNNGKRVVVAGTCFQYEFVDGVYSESKTPKNPFYTYGICKQKLNEFFNEYLKNTNLCGAWGYVFYPYGIGDSPNKLIPQAVQTLLNGAEFKLSSGDQIKDYIYIKDVAEAFVEILDSEIEGGINIGSGEGITVKDITLKLAKLLGKENLVKIGAVLSYSNEPKEIIADISKMKDILHWEPKYRIEQGLAETVKFYTELYKVKD